MSGKFGGGGNNCTICEKTAYPAETIQFEKKPYHVECFRCKECSKKMEGAAVYEEGLYCKHCFNKGGFAQKQKKVVWTKKEGGDAVKGGGSKFGGAGNPCTVCAKTVYAAETLSFEKKVYHAECFTCGECSKKMTASDAAAYECTVYCRKCFQDGGYQQKQAKQKQAKSVGTGANAGTSNAIASKFGGGGNKCKLCDKTVYDAETVSYEKLVYHGDCFKCSACAKIMSPSGAATFEDALFCTKCFKDGDYSRKQAQEKKQNKKKQNDAANAMASKFGGGGTKCVTCDKAVYAAETLAFEKQAYHADCFKCLHCDKKMTPSSAEGQKQEDGSVKVYCKKCWGELGLNRA